jgi:hypothetical protein
MAVSPVGSTGSSGSRAADQAPMLPDLPQSIGRTGVAVERVGLSSWMGRGHDTLRLE